MNIVLIDRMEGVNNPTGSTRDPEGGLTTSSKDTLKTQFPQIT